MTTALDKTYALDEKLYQLVESYIHEWDRRMRLFAFKFQERNGEYRMVIVNRAYGVAANNGTVTNNVRGIEEECGYCPTIKDAFSAKKLDEYQQFMQNVCYFWCPTDTMSQLQSMVTERYNTRQDVIDNANEAFWELIRTGVIDGATRFQKYVHYPAIYLALQENNPVTVTDGLPQFPGVSIAKLRLK